MADNELKLHVSADTKSARDEFKALGTEAQKAFNGLGEQGQIAAQKLAALDKAWDSPAKLGKAAALAKLELEELAGAVDKAGKMTPELARQFDTASQKIDTASARARAFADVAGDLKDRGEFAANGMEALANSAGSVEGVLRQLGASGSAFGDLISKAGFAVIAFNQGLELGKKALDGYKAALKDLETAYVGMVQRQVDAATKSATLEAATRAVGKGLIEAGRSAGETAEKYKSYVENTLRAAEGTDKFAKSLDGVKVPKGLTEFRDEAIKLNTVLANAWKEGGDRFREYAKENESLLTDIAERYRRNGDTIPEYIQRGIKANEEAAKAEERYKKSVEDGKTAMEDKLKGMVSVWEQQQAAIKAGEEIVKQEQAGTKSYGEAKKELTELAAKYGLTEEGLRKLIEANKDYKRAVDEFHGLPSLITDENIRAIDGYIAAMARLERAMHATNAEAIRHQAIVQDLANVHGQASGNAEELGRVHRAMADSIAAGVEPVVRMTITQIELTEATEAQVKALYDQVEAFKAVENQQSKVIDLAAQILSDYQTGQVGIITTLERVAENLRQLYDILGKNMNTPFEAEIRKWIKAFEDLQATLRMGGVQKTEGMRLF